MYRYASRNPGTQESNWHDRTVAKIDPAFESAARFDDLATPCLALFPRHDGHFRRRLRTPMQEFRKAGLPATVSPVVIHSRRRGSARLNLNELSVRSMVSLRIGKLLGKLLTIIKLENNYIFPINRISNFFNTIRQRGKFKSVKIPFPRNFCLISDFCQIEHAIAKPFSSPLIYEISEVTFLSL